MTASGMWLDSGTPTRVPHSFQSQLVGDCYCALGKVLCTFGPHLWPCVSPLHTWCAPSLLVAPPACASQSPRTASSLGGYECGACVSDWINPPLPIRDFRALQCALFKQQTARRSAQECVWQANEKKDVGLGWTGGGTGGHQRSRRLIHRGPFINLCLPSSFVFPALDGFCKEYIPMTTNYRRLGAKPCHY